MLNPRKEPARATVVARGRSIEYLVAGCGPSLLLLAGEPARRRLMDELALTHRVVSPILDQPPDDHDDRSWLSDFLDGIGLDDVRVVVDPSWTAPLTDEVPRIALQLLIGHRDG